MFGPYRIPYIDSLYFWDTNVDHRVGRAMMARNFSNISVGVLKQVRVFVVATCVVLCAVPAVCWPVLVLAC
jgi:hypothetical protein